MNCVKAKNKLKAEFEEWDDANRRLEFYSTLLVPANFPDGHSNILKFVKDALLHFQLIGVHFLDLFCGHATGDAVVAQGAQML